MNAIKDLFASERGFFALVLVIAATVLAGMSLMTIDQWQSFSLTIFGIYATGKTVTGVVGLIKGSAAAAPAADPAAIAAAILATPVSATSTIAPGPATPVA